MEKKTKDLLKLSEEPEIVNKEKVYYSCLITKFNDMGYRQERGIALTEQAIYNLKKKQIQRRIPYEKLDSITMSKMSSEFVLHVKEENDYRFISYEHRMPIVETILYILCKVKKLCTVFKVYHEELVNLDTVMTTHAKEKEKQWVRPAEDKATLVDLEKFEKEEEKETTRKSEIKKNTKMLYKKNSSEKSELSLDDFELLKVLGKGAFGKVILAQKLDSKKLYAIKILKKKDIIDMDQLEHTKAEKAILQHVNHPFIVGLEYAFQTPEKVYFVLEFLLGGELFQHLRASKKFSEEMAKFYTACIAMAIGHLHNKNYIYRDLKLENVLLDSKGYAKLTDFGLSKFINPDDKATTFCGTPEYMAPEVVMGKGHNRPADWWALGVLAYEMMYGIPAFYAKNPQDMYQKIAEEAVAFRSGIEVSPEGKDLILQLLIKDDKKRLGSRGDSLEVLSHPWFKSIDLAKLVAKQLPAPFVPQVDGDLWLKNFDTEFTSEHPRDSECDVDPEELKSIQAKFSNMEYNKDLDPTVAKH